MESSNYQLPIGTVLSSGERQYRIVGVLGQGGFGITYKATGKVKVGNIEVNVLFAIKEHFIKQYNERRGTTVTIPNSSNATEVNESLDAFLTEAQRLNRLSLNHSGIVKVNENFRANGTAYYVMEYIEGESLRHYVERHAGGRLPEAEATGIIRQVGQSVQYLHDHRTTHLDIKPDNILLRTDGQPVLIDFGLSKHYDRKGNATSTLKVQGTSDGYSPLEQYAGITRFSPKADIYALAATLLFMLTGKTPAAAADIRPATISAMLEPVAGAATAKAVLHAMAMLPDNRAETIIAFLEELSEQIAPTSEPEPIPLVAGKADTSETRKSNVMAAPKKSRFTKKQLAMGAVAVAAILMIVLYIALGLEKDTAETKVVKKTEMPDNEVDMEESADSPDVVSFTLQGVSFNMVHVKGGTFQMGATDEMKEPWDDELPVHQVTLSSFYIGETEVTQEQWEAVMGSNPSNFNGAKLPVESVSWEDCQEFIDKLNTLTSRTFRLPTEAEWEFAARGGNKRKWRQYSGSDDLDEVAWYEENSDSITHNVGTKLPNELGIYDMSGNVWELCQDWFGDYDSYAQTNPKGPSSGSYRVYRGGSWDSDARNCRSSYRDGCPPSGRYISLGFRLAL